MLKTSASTKPALGATSDSNLRLLSHLPIAPSIRRLMPVFAQRKRSQNKLISLAGNRPRHRWTRRVRLAMHLAFLAGIVTRTSVAVTVRGRWFLGLLSFSVGASGLRIPRRAHSSGCSCDRGVRSGKIEEARSWRSIGEICATGREMLLNAVVIGSTHNKRRASHWTRALAHHVIGDTLQEADGECQFAGSWETVQRRHGKDYGRLAIAMQVDECFAELIHSMRISVPVRRKAPPVRWRDWETRPDRRES